MDDYEAVIFYFENAGWVLVESITTSASFEEIIKEVSNVR